MNDEQKRQRAIKLGGCVALAAALFALLLSWLCGILDKL